MDDYLYEKVCRVTPISDDQVQAMRHILPVLRDDETGMYREISGAESLHPRKVSFLWNAQPIGKPFTFDVLNQSVIITQHHSCVFFKPSLAEVYSWIRVYMPESWGVVSRFHLRSPQRVGSSSDFMCECVVMGGRRLVRGRPMTLANGETAYELVSR